MQQKTSLLIPRCMLLRPCFDCIKQEVKGEARGRQKIQQDVAGCRSPPRKWGGVNAPFQNITGKLLK